MKKLLTVFLVLSLLGACGCAAGLSEDPTTASVSSPTASVTASVTDRTSAFSQNTGSDVTDDPTGSTSGTTTFTDTAVTTQTVPGTTGTITDTHTDPTTVSTTDPGPKTFTDPVTGRPMLYDDPAAVCPVLVFDHYKNDLYLMDASVTDWDDPKAILWKWTCKTAKGGKYTKYASTCVDHKYRKNASTGAEYIVTGGHAYGCLVSYPDGEILWDVGVAGANIHSMEYLPDGNIALANSGGWLRLYAVNSAREESPYYAEDLFDGCHGVLWDPQRQSLWSIGTPSLREYKVGGTKAKPTLTMIHEYKLPSSGGHDLAAVYGNTDLLWCTAGSTWIFSKSQGKFYSNFTDYNAIGHGGVKGIGNFPGRSTMLWVYGNGIDGKDYHSDRIYVAEWKLTTEGKLKCVTSQRVSSSFSFYKLRVFCSDYQ